MKYEIKKIAIWPAARFAGIFFGLMSLVPAAFTLMVYFLNNFRYHEFSVKIFGILLLPLGFFAAGFIIGLIFVLVYNELTDYIGGIKLEIDYHED